MEVNVGVETKYPTVKSRQITAICNVLDILPTIVTSPTKQIRLILGGGVGYLSVWLTGLGKLVGGAATDILTATTTRSNPSKTSGVAGSNTVYITAGRRSLACSVDI